MTTQELIERLRLYDEVTVMELLDIHTDELIDAFLDKIKERYNYIHDKIEDPNI